MLKRAGNTIRQLAVDLSLSPRRNTEGTEEASQFPQQATQGSKQAQVFAHRAVCISVD